MAVLSLFIIVGLVLIGTLWAVRDSYWYLLDQVEVVPWKMLRFVLLGFMVSGIMCNITWIAIPFLYAIEWGFLEVGLYAFLFYIAQKMTWPPLIVLLQNGWSK